MSEQLLPERKCWKILKKGDYNYLEKERSRKRKNKTPGKENVCEQVVTPYKTPKSYGKAMRRLECVMPESPRKKKALIEHGLQN